MGRKSSKHLSIIIPAAGAGRWVHASTPRPLVNICGETILQRQFRILREVYPFAEMILVVGHAADEILEHKSLDKTSLRVVENEHHGETGVVRSIQMGLRVRSRPDVLIVHGDLVFNHKAFAGVTGDGSAVVADDCKQIGRSEVGLVRDDRGFLSHMSFGLPTKWAQIAYLVNRELRLFETFSSFPLHRKSVGFEAINIVASSGGRFRVVSGAGMRVAEVDMVKDLESARRVAKEGLS